MADTVTPHLGLVKPEVNGAHTENVWGFDLNANFDKIDVFAAATDVMADAPSDGNTFGRQNAAWVQVPTAVNFWDLIEVVNSKAPIASPVFTGNPTAPTPAAADNDTSIATTAFVKGVAIAAGAVFPSDTNPLASGAAAPGVSTNYSRADHVHPASTDSTKVAKAGDTMTGQLGISAGNLHLYGFSGNSATSVIYMNNAADAYIYQDGATFRMVGKPVNINSILGSTLPSNGALTVQGGVGIGGQLNVGGALDVSGAGTFGNSLKIPIGTGIGWGNFPGVAGTPQLTYNGAKFDFSGRVSVKADASAKGLDILGRASDSRSEICFKHSSVDTNFAQLVGTPSGLALAAGDFYVSSTSDSYSAGTGSIATAGGLGVGLDIFTGGQIFVNGATTAWAVGVPNAIAVKFTGASTQNGIGMRATVNNSNAMVFANAEGNALIGWVYVTYGSTVYASAAADLRFVDDVKPIDSGDLIDRLDPVAYRWKGSGERGFGLIAADAVKVIPQACVRDEQADQWGADYSKLVPILLAEMKALRLRVAELEGRA